MGKGWRGIGTFRGAGKYDGEDVEFSTSERDGFLAGRRRGEQDDKEAGKRISQGLDGRQEAYWFRKIQLITTMVYINFQATSKYPG